MVHADALTHTLALTGAGKRTDAHVHTLVKVADQRDRIVGNRLS